MNYLGIDLGGSKTLIALFDKSGNIIAKQKFKTNQNYEDFLLDLEKNVAGLPTNTNIIACSAAIPGLISRENGIVHALGNLGWKDKPIRDDIAKLIGNVPVIIENDARAAGLAEAGGLTDTYRTVLFLTVSTGIGGALLEDGKIVRALQDMETGQMPLLYDDKLQKWEDFASGKSIVARYGKQASDIEDEQQWREVGERIAYGVAVCASVLQPEAIVFGGGVGQFADKFIPAVKSYLAENLSPLVKEPALLAPAYSSDSAINGCFTLLKQRGFVK